jgi:polysaccharide biosynthesis/export protein
VGWHAPAPRATLPAMRVACFILLLSVVAGCPPKLPDHPYAQEPDPRNKELVLGVGDVVSINIWENRELNTDATIRPDGTITMPLVGDLKAAGETPSALKQQIKTKLGAYLKITPGTEPVTIAVKEWRSYRFTVHGEVQRQGAYTSDHFVTVSEAIAMAGGLSRFAKPSETKLFRTDPKTKERREIPLDYDAIVSGKRPDMDIFVLPEDHIWVP